MSHSRIIVKNLPKLFNEGSLKEHFSTKGAITDVKLMKTQNGVSRRFAYIGYETELEAEAAIKFFNNTFVFTSKIQVELAKPPQDVSLSKPGSQCPFEASKEHFMKRNSRVGSTDSNHTKRTQSELSEKKRKLLALYEDENDPELKAYLQAMKSRSQAKTWANDDDMFELPTKNDQKKKKTDTNEPSLSSTSADVKANLEEEDGLYQDLPTDLKKERVQSKTQALFEERALPEIETQRMNQDKCNISQEELILETGRLFVRNLSFHVKEEDVSKLFSAFGSISETHLPLTSDTKRPKGLAFISFVMPEHALNAFKALNGNIFQGRIIQIIASKEKPTMKNEQEITEDTKSYKLRKAQELKKNALSSLNWNTLFVNNDAVMEYISKQLGVKKGDLLHSDSDDLATRMALAETHVIQETKKYFEEEGVVFDAPHHSPSKLIRSKTTLLIKNIPYSTKEEELSSLFIAFGKIQRIILPPTRVIALVEFVDASEAKNAFQNLAYKKFKHIPLYLEFAPEGLLTTPSKDKTTSKKSTEELNVKAVIKADSLIHDILSEEVNEEAVSNILFIKNLNFNTTDADLYNKLKPLGGFVRASISKRRNPKKPEQVLSCGYGFAEFDSQTSAQAALSQLQDVVLDGHALTFKFSQMTNKPSSSTAEAVASKIIIRNIPFEAVAKDIRGLFQPFGQIKKIRLPKKMDGTHRGFAFIEFASKKEAQAAFEAVRHSHLYGRHLVLEWANQDDADSSKNLEKIREKTKEQLKSLQLDHSKSKKITASDDDSDESIE